MSQHLNMTANKNMQSENSGSNTTSSQKMLSVNREADRLQTFASWTNDSVCKYKLAKCGFYYKGPNDAVECAYCEVVISHWSLGDDPLREHIGWSPSCPFLLDNVDANEALEENVDFPLFNNTVCIAYNNEKMPDTVYQPTKKIVLSKDTAARYPKYRSKKNRLESFQFWPKQLVRKHTPEMLSEAGLFYLGIGDQVKCFYCGGGLCNWNDNDQPWIEHARLYKHCDYIKECKGEKFIEEAGQLIIDEQPNSSDKINVNNEMIQTSAKHTISKKCNICMLNDLEVIFLPCMHCYTCAKCGFAFTHCPVCRLKIDDLKRIIFI